MSKVNYVYLLILTFLLLSCSNDDSEKGYTDEKGQVNNFIWNGLNSWYLWKDKVPSLSESYFNSQEEYKDYIFQQSPENLFYSSLYQFNVVDKFSWIVDDVDALLKAFTGVSLSSGLDITFSYLTESEDTVIGFINYVVPNSPADQQGIERGDMILAVNGTQLNIDNYQNVLDDSFAITIAVDPFVHNGTINFSDERNVNITAVELDENPVHYTQVYTQGTQQIGYIVYNGYKSVYNDELNQAFADFKAAGVTDLILDLRYNGGGSLNTAIGLSQMITGQFNNQPFVSLEFNDKHNNRNRQESFSNKLPIYEFNNGQTNQIGEEIIHSLGLNQLYVLTSKGTASASELTISALEPYIDVIQIGSRTYGKFVGSITLFDHPNSDYTNYGKKNTAHNYAMQPIVFAYYNINHQELSDGLEPDYSIEFGEYIGMRDFGEMSDPALAEALEQITGSTFRIDAEKVVNFSMDEIGTSKMYQPLGNELYIEP